MERQKRERSAQLGCTVCAGAACTPVARAAARTAVSPCRVVTLWSAADCWTMHARAPLHCASRILLLQQPRAAAAGRCGGSQALQQLLGRQPWAVPAARLLFGLGADQSFEVAACAGRSRCRVARCPDSMHGAGTGALGGLPAAARGRGLPRAPHGALRRLVATAPASLMPDGTLGIGRTTCPRVVCAFLAPGRCRQSARDRTWELQSVLRSQIKASHCNCARFHESWHRDGTTAKRASLALVAVNVD